MTNRHFQFFTAVHPDGTEMASFWVQKIPDGRTRVNAYDCLGGRMSCRAYYVETATEAIVKYCEYLGVTDNMPTLVQTALPSKLARPRVYADIRGCYSWGNRKYDTANQLLALRTDSAHPVYRPHTEFAHKQLGKNVRAVMALLRDDDTGYGSYEATERVHELLDDVVDTLNGYDVANARAICRNLRYAAEDSPWWGNPSSYFIRKLDCGHYIRDEQDNEVTGAWHTFCGRCRDDGDRYVWVQDSGEYARIDDVYYWDSDGEYHYDSEPEEDDDDDDGGDYLSGWRTSTEYMDHDKSFTPSWDGDFTMGVELECEVSNSSDRRDTVEECDSYFNATRRYAMFKQDSSLSDSCGFEIVTAARRLSDHITTFDKWSKPSGLTSWDAGTCGMHVHIDSRAFTALSLGKFLMFYNRPENKRLIRSIAGRHPDEGGQAKRYAAALTHTADPKVVKHPGENSSRYRMVNVTNLTDSEQERLGIKVDRDCKGSYSTVEIRIFRGTLRKARLLAQLEFAHASVAFCRQASWNGLGETEFKAWLATTAAYPHLTRWFGTSRARNSRYAQAEEVRSESVEA